jgi:hypothetical protein
LLALGLRLFARSFPVFLIREAHQGATKSSA